MLGVDWPTCPVRCATEDPKVQHIVDLEQLGEPIRRMDMAAWVPPMLSGYRAELEAAAAQRRRVEAMTAK